MGPMDQDCCKRFLSRLLSGEGTKLRKLTHMCTLQAANLKAKDYDSYVCYITKIIRILLKRSGLPHKHIH